MIEILYKDREVLVCIKPAGTLSELSEDKNSLPRIIIEENEESEENSVIPNNLDSIPNILHSVCSQETTCPLL